MTDETIDAFYRFTGGLFVGILIGISWVAFHHPNSSLFEAFPPILVISSLTGIVLVLLPNSIREIFWQLTWWPYLTPFRLFLLIMMIEGLILKFAPHPAGGLIERILHDHWWNWW